MCLIQRVSGGAQFDLPGGLQLGLQLTAIAQNLRDLVRNPSR